MPDDREELSLDLVAQANAALQEIVATRTHELMKANKALQLEISERKMAEAALRESEEKYRKLSETANDMIITTNLEGIITYANPAAIGLAEGARLDGRAMKDFIPPELVPMHAEMMDARRQGFSESLSYEWRLRSLDKSTTRIVDVRSSLLTDNGKPAGILFIARDVTERKHAEEAIQRTFSLLEATLESTADGILVVDREGCVTRFNRKFLSLWQIPESLAVSGTDERLVAFVCDQLKDPEDFVQNIRQRYSDPEKESFDILEFKDGRILERYSQPHRTGEKIVGRVWSFRDITERRAAEDKYRNIFTNAIDGISQATIDGRYIDVNPAFARMFGYDTPAEMITSIKDIARQTYVRPERRLEYLQCLQENGYINNFEVERYRKDGSRIWVSYTSRAVKDAKGNILYLEGISKDITAMKLLEKQLFEAQKMEALGTLAGGIAHDFNNILGAIIGYAELAAEEGEEEPRKAMIDEVLNASDRARNLIRQILAFSRHSESEKKPLDLKIITREVLKLLGSTIPATIEIRKHITTKICPVYADPTQMHQVLLNLCTNGMQAMGEKGGILDVSLSQMEITSGDAYEMPDLRPGPYIKLMVSDTGHGIDPDIIKRIFDPFFTTKRVGEGTGLGLSVVYGIIKNHAGTVTVASRPGEGSTFNIYLPSAENTEPVVRVQSAESIQKGHERILFVDDEKTLVDLGDRILTPLGYQVTPMTNSVEALALFLTAPENFDLIITDMTMPHITGSDLAREALAARPDMPVILCTGFNEYMTEEKAEQFGIKALVLKPLSRQELTKVIRTVLDRKE